MATPSSATSTQKQELCEQSCGRIQRNLRNTSRPPCRARKLLLDFNWLLVKPEKTDVTALLSDYDFL